MENAIWCSIGVVFGIPAGLITNYFWDLYKARDHRLTLQSLCGLWLEQFGGRGDGSFALGAFRWDYSRKEFRYDGTRFDADGKPMYEWITRSLFSDDRLGAIVYTYELERSGAEPVYGLGEIKYRLQAGMSSNQFVKGVFSDGDDDIDVHHEMVRFSEFARATALQEGEDKDSRHKLGKYVAQILASQKQQRGGANCNEFMASAISEAEAGLAEGGIPIGAVLVHENKIIGRGHNRRVQKGSSILHGEMDALKNSGRLSSTVYSKSVLYTTLSPCAMCSGAILLYRIPRVVIGENNTFMGEEELLRSRGVIVDVVQDTRCIEMMRQFIREHPVLWNEDIGV